MHASVGSECAPRRPQSLKETSVSGRVVILLYVSVVKPVTHELTLVMADVSAVVFDGRHCLLSVLVHMSQALQ